MTLRRSEQGVSVRNTKVDACKRRCSGHYLDKSEFYRRCFAYGDRGVMVGREWRTR